MWTRSPTCSHGAAVRSTRRRRSSCSPACSAPPRNHGTLPFLDEDAVVEVPAQVTAGSVEPIEMPALDPLYQGLVAHVSAYEALALAAALHGGRERVFRALLGHPLVGQVRQAEALTDLLLQANARYLPWAS
jgi:6-phospho-beta-glucosidase